MQAHSIAAEMKIDNVSSRNKRILDKSTKNTPATEISNIVLRKNFSIFFISVVLFIHVLYVVKLPKVVSVNCQYFIVELNENYTVFALLSLRLTSVYV